MIIVRVLICLALIALATCAGTIGYRTAFARMDAGERVFWWTHYDEGNSSVSGIWSYNRRLHISNHRVIVTNANWRQSKTWPGPVERPDASGRARMLFMYRSSVPTNKAQCLTRRVGRESHGVCDVATWDCSIAGWVVGVSSFAASTLLCLIAFAVARQFIGAASRGIGFEISMPNPVPPCSSLNRP